MEMPLHRHFNEKSVLNHWLKLLYHFVNTVPFPFAKEYFSEKKLTRQNPIMILILLTWQRKH